MADMNFDRFDATGRDGDARRSDRAQTLVNLSGAAISVVLVVGLAVWGYKLAVRDVSGIPVVLALDEPMRVAPENPGGTVADNQGLAVNAVAAEGSAVVPPTERLVLAPRPVELSLEDEPGLLAVTPVEAEDQLDDILVDAATTPAAAAVSEAIDQTSIELALAAALSEGEVISVDPAPAAETASETVVATDAIGGVVRSPRPVARPSSQTGTPAPAPAVAAAEPVADVADVQDVVSVASPEMLPEDVPVGTRLVQLGAFDSADGARAEWTRLQGNFGDLMAGKAIIVQPAESGGQTFFRLRAFGFSDEDDARRFCSALLSEDTACIPVAQR